MKRKLIALILILCLILCGCGKESRPAEWEDSWTAIAPCLASEGLEGFTFAESADTFGIGGVYYATWTQGAKREYTNAQGEETFIFDAQLYAVVQECRTEAEADQSISAWIAREQQNYSCAEPREVLSNDRTYTLLSMNQGSEGNPYPFGCAAFTRIGTNALCVELVCAETFTGDPQALLEAFLSGLHYHE